MHLQYRGELQVRQYIPLFADADRGSSICGHFGDSIPASAIKKKESAYHHHNLTASIVLTLKGAGIMRLQCWDDRFTMPQCHMNMKTIIL